MVDFSFRKRHRLKGKQVKALGVRMEEVVGVDMLSAEPAVDRARGVDMDYLIIDGRVAYLVEDEVAFPSLRTLLDRGLDTRWVEVDAGAIRFLANGADVMAPGVCGADAAVNEGDWVYVRDATHGRPLVVGKALMSGPEMTIADKGRAIKTVHYVSDSIWDFE
jgi:PUA-domain protein